MWSQLTKYYLFGSGSASGLLGLTSVVGNPLYWNKKQRLHSCNDRATLKLLLSRSFVWKVIYICWLFILL